MTVKVLYADPPWKFGDALPGPKRGAKKHYKVLSLGEISNFELPKLDDNCWLFLWKVGAMPLEALTVIKSWGFVPKSEVVWVKTAAAAPAEGQSIRLRIGMGRSVRNCHEVCVVCTRGKPVRASAAVPSVFFAPRTEHSSKPEKMYEIIEELTGPMDPAERVELFARTRQPGWTSYGDEL